MCLQFGFVFFLAKWQKDFGAKAAHKMLVKLTPGKYNRTCSQKNLFFSEGLTLSARRG